MSGLRGSRQLWGTGNTGATVGNSGTTGATGAVSPRATIGAQQNVAVYIANTGATGATFTVQVAANASNAPGENALDDTDPDEGLTWFDYDRMTGLTVGPGVAKAVDLSPFAPQYLRLKRTDSTGAATIVAFVSSEAP